MKISDFPSPLKQANITPVFKKEERECKSNYRPVSILSDVSKIFERIIFRQISNYMDSFFSKHQCGLGKNIAHNNVFCPCLKNENMLWIMGRDLDYC